MKSHVRSHVNYAYLCSEVDGDNLRGAIDGFRALKVRGWNVSTPNKSDVIQYLDETDKTVDLIADCNMVVNDDGVLTGYNTDGSGWVAGLRENGADVKGGTITVMGAGRTSTAIVIQAARDGADKIHMFNRKDRFYESGEQMVAKITDRSRTAATMGDVEDLDAFKQTVALSNAANVGMKPLEGSRGCQTPPSCARTCSSPMWSNAPPRSKFWEQAEAAGCQFINGLPMMYHQGSTSFKLFTDRDMPLDYVREHMFDEGS